MTDIVERLRKASFQEWQEYPSSHVQGAKWPVASNIGEEAAAEIERLRLSLSEARDAGRREGMEDAAGILFSKAGELRANGNPTSKAMAMIFEDQTDAIRAAMEK